MTERTQRRLAAIVSADVVGYSRLMGVDEVGTLADLRAHRGELVDGLIAEHGGRIVKTMGDGLLLEFPSVVEATECAIKVQRGMAARNENVDLDQRIIFRIGVNLGDVIIEGDDILGDGVNLAARLQEIAAPGGVAVSGRVHEDVRARLEAKFEDTGEQSLKNIDQPVRVWRWLQSQSSNVAASESFGGKTQPLSDKPSLAVLPFDNMSGDPEQEYFSDGMAEDIITALSRFHQFFVIARNSSFTYKGQAVDIKQVAGELGVQYVIEGSVRRAGNRVRITAQLIDAATSNHIWAERYDRELDDIFAVQDEITERVAMAMGPELAAAEVARVRRKSVPELGIWEKIARANWHGSKFTEKDNGKAENLLAGALDVDPENARIHAALSATYLLDALYNWRRPPTDSRTMTLEMAQRAVNLDREDEFAHAQLGAGLLVLKRHEDSTQRLRTAVSLNPNYSQALGTLGVVLVYTHNYDEGLELLQKAIQLSPKDPLLPMYLVVAGIPHFNDERYDEARMWAEKALHENPNFPTGHRFLAAVLGMLGDLDAARAAYENFDRMAPGMTVKACVQAVPFAFEVDAKRFAEGLRRAGMPEG